MLRERIIWLVAVFAIGGAAFYGGTVFGQQQGAQRRTQAAQQFFSQRGGTSGMMLAGTVSAVTDTSVTVKTRDGQTQTLELAAGGTVRKQADGALSDIKAGDTVVAQGTQSGTTFQATTIQIGQIGQIGGAGGPGGAPGQAGQQGQDGGAGAPPMGDPGQGPPPVAP
jgi:hypothetical protein